MVMVRSSASASKKSPGPTWPHGKTPKAAKAPKGPKVKKPEVKIVGAVPGLNVGLKSGLQVHAFWGLVLGQQAKAKLNDAELESVVAVEFPKRDKVQPAGRLRAWYNCGTYAAMGLAPGGVRGTNGKHPPERCLRYEDGKPVGKGAPKAPKTVVVKVAGNKIKVRAPRTEADKINAEINKMVPGGKAKKAPKAKK